MKTYISTGITFLVTAGILFFIYGCPVTTTSLLHNDRQVTREEFQLELETIKATAAFRMADMKQQDEFRSLLIENAWVILNGQPFNPLGLLTGAAAIYGIASGGYQIGGSVKRKVKNGKVKNGEV